MLGFWYLTDQGLIRAPCDPGLTHQSVCASLLISKTGTGIVKVAVRIEHITFSVFSVFHFWQVELEPSMGPGGTVTSYCVFFPSVGERVCGNRELPGELLKRTKKSSWEKQPLPES